MSEAKIIAQALLGMLEDPSLDTTEFEPLRRPLSKLVGGGDSNPMPRPAVSAFAEQSGPVVVLGDLKAIKELLPDGHMRIIFRPEEHPEKCPRCGQDWP